MDLGWWWWVLEKSTNADNCWHWVMSTWGEMGFIMCSSTLYMLENILNKKLKTPVPGRQVPITLAVQTNGGWDSRRNFRILRGILLKGLNRLRTYADSLPLGPSTGAAAGRAPVAYGEKLKCLASQVSAGGQLPPRQNSRGQALSLCWALHHTEPQSGNTISETPSTWFTWFVPI